MLAEESIGAVEKVHDLEKELGGEKDRIKSLEQKLSNVKVSMFCGLVCVNILWFLIGVWIFGLFWVLDWIEVHGLYLDLDLDLYLYKKWHAISLVIQVFSCCTVQYNVEN